MRSGKTCKTVFDPLYDHIIADLVGFRRKKGMTQRVFASKSGYTQCFIAKTEHKDRRMDLVEVIRYLTRLGLTKKEIKVKLTEWADLFVE